MELTTLQLADLINGDQGRRESALAYLGKSLDRWQAEKEAAQKCIAESDANIEKLQAAIKRLKGRQK